MRFVLLSALLIFFLSCDPCRYVDCVNSDYLVDFYLVDSSGNDLVFGPAAKYSPEQITAFALDGDDTVKIQVAVLPYGSDSILSAWLYPPRSPFYLQTSPGDTDTLQLRFESRKTRCCGTVVTYSDVRFNGVVVHPSLGTLTFIK